MIALRLAGCCCILAFSVMWCVRYASSLVARLSAVERAARFVALVRREIEYYETEFPRIVRKFAVSEGLATSLSPEGGDTEAARTIYSSHGGDNAGGTRSACSSLDSGNTGDVRSVYSSLDGDDAEVARMICAPLDSDDAEKFLSFFRQVGAGFSDTELRLCDETSLYFAERLAALRADFAQKRRVNASLALFAAISVCILIL